MGSAADLSQKIELESFLSNSLHYFNNDYYPSYSHLDYNRKSDLFKAIGLNCKVGEILHPLERGYAKFWEKRARAANHSNKRIRKYVKRFFDWYKPRANLNNFKKA